MRDNTHTLRRIILLLLLSVVVSVAHDGGGVKESCAWNGPMGEGFTAATAFKL